MNTTDFFTLVSAPRPLCSGMPQAAGRSQSQSDQKPVAKLLHGHCWDVPRGTSRGQRGVICEREPAEVQDYATKKPQ